MVSKNAPFLPWRNGLVIAFAMIASGAAMAQWQWIDGTGRKVFSDTPPPSTVPEKSIVKRPGLRTPAVAATTTPTGTEATGSTSTGAAPKLSGRDEQLEARKKQAEETEQAKKKVEEERQAKARAENCDRAKRAKTTLDSGIRIATTNAKGEREIMDDAARAAEGKRLDDLIRSECSASVN